MFLSFLSKPPFIAFYSFKGGVGRSMALINVAVALAARGRRVLAIDLDLEAPGISYLLHEEHDPSVPGFIDLVHDFFAEPAQSAVAIDTNPKGILKYAHILTLPEKICPEKGGSLRIMPSGRMNTTYEKRRQDMDLHGLYKQGEGKPLILRMRDAIIESGEFDYVLIDSRTGFSDEAGVAIRDLGDHLVILHGLNRQNVEGTARYLERVRQVVPASCEIHFVASPIPQSEDELLEMRTSIAEKRFSEVMGKEIKLNHKINYHPRLALDDEPALFRWRRGPLYEAYTSIEQLVREMSRDTAAEWAGHAKVAVGKDDDKAIHYFQEAIRLGGAPDALLTSACHDSRGEPSFIRYCDLLESAAPRSRNSLNLAINHFEQIKDRDRLEERYRMALEFAPDDVLFLLAFGKFLRQERDKPKEAEEHIRRALVIEPKNACLIAELGNLAWYNDKNEAEVHYRKALKLAPDDPQLLSVFGLFMWYGRANYDETERLYRAAFKIEPRDETIVGRLANFLWKVRKDPKQAESLYLQAINLRPDAGINLGNYGGFLLANKRWKELDPILRRAWAASFQKQDQVSAEVAFYRAVQLRHEEKNDTTPLGYLKYLLEAKFPRALWSFEEVLNMAGEKFNAEYYALYKRLAAAILDAEKVPALSEIPRWKYIHAEAPTLMI